MGIDLTESSKESTNSEHGVIKNKNLFGIIIVFFITFGMLAVYGVSNYLKTVALDSLAKSNAEQTSILVFEIVHTKMQEGWNKSDVNHIIARINSLHPDTQIALYRSNKVKELFGDIDQSGHKLPYDSYVQKALLGEFQFVPDIKNKTARYIYPIKNEQSCITCHTNSNVGEVSGVMDINMSSNSLQAPIQSIVEYFQIFTLVAMIITFVVLQITINMFLLKPITNFTNVIESIVTSGKLNEYVKCKSKTHEIKVLEHSFNHMMEKISTALMEVKNRNKLLEEYKRAIDKSAIVTKTNTRGVITYVNEQFTEISGYKEDELIGKSHNIVRSPNMPKKVFADLWSTISQKRVWKGIVENRKKNGESYFVNATILPILDEHDEIIEFIGIRQDITELKTLQLEELTQSIKQAVTINTKEMVKMFPFPAASIDQDDHVVAINDSFKFAFEQYAFNTTFLTDLFISNAGSGYVSKDEILDWKDIVLDLQNEGAQKVLINTEDVKKEYFIILSKHATDKNYLVLLIPSEFCGAHRL